MAEIRVESVTKAFAGLVAVADVSLTIRDKEFMVLLGPSGCGKTTLLRLIAGFEMPDAGTVYIDGRDVTELAPRRRGISMVFQSYALFPHLRVFDNLAFGLRMRHLRKAETDRRVRSAAELMQIGELLQRYPSQLSGGQRQRVAVARALVMEPAVILMDEPLSNLDALLRLQMRAELKRLLKEAETTTLYVTHDQTEALGMGDRIAVMRDGCVVQCDSPMAVYDHPQDVFVARFIGDPPMNILAATVEDGGVWIDGHHLELATDGFEPGRNVTVGIRPENVEVKLRPSNSAMEAFVVVTEPLGSRLLVTLSFGDQVIKAWAQIDLRIEPKQRVWIDLDRSRLQLLNANPREVPSPSP